MIIGIPRELKENECRVSILPVGVELLCEAGHEVLFESGAGTGSGYEDEQYHHAGGHIVTEHGALFDRAEMIV